jgi:hypothetical protein
MDNTDMWGYAIIALVAFILGIMAGMKWMNYGN